MSNLKVADDKRYMGLLFLVLMAQCEVTEYCVKPSDSVNISSNHSVEPCHILDYYTDPLSEYLKLNNTVFTLLPGNHSMTRPLVFENVENVSLQVASGERAYLELAPTFQCEITECIPLTNTYFYVIHLDICCPLLQMTGVNHATIGGFTIVIAKSGVSGVLTQASTDIQFHENSVYFDENISSETGVVVIDSSDIMINVIQVRAVSFGIIIFRANNINITNADLMLCSNCGVLGIYLNNTRFINSTMTHNLFGCVFGGCKDTLMENLSVHYNIGDGVIVMSCVNCEMRSLNMSYNQWNGISAIECHLTTIVDLITTDNNNAGIWVYGSSNIDVVNVTSTHMVHVSMHIEQCVNIALNGATIGSKKSGEIGVQIIIVDCTNTILNNITVEDSSKNEHVMSVVRSHNTTLTDITAVFSGVFVHNCSVVNLRNVSVDHSGLIFLYCKNVILEDSIFTNIYSDLVTSATDVMEMPAVITAYNTSLVLRNCTFFNNNISSIMATASTIRVEGNVSFSNISAISGAAFIFSKSSVLILPEHSNVVFENNHANYYGAAFYIITEEFIETSTPIDNILLNFMFNSEMFDVPLTTVISFATKCFIQVVGTRSSARLTFINNRAERGGDIVYGGLVATGYDGDWNCLLSFKNISDMTRQSSEIPSRRITSAPSRVCICRDEQPDCLIVADSTPHVLYPGQNVTVSAAVVGQDFGTVTGEVHAQFLSSFACSISPEQQVVQYDNGACKAFNYTVHSSCDTCEAKLVLTPDDREVSKSMSVVDNMKINTSWHILLSDPSYHALAIHSIHKFVEYEPNLTDITYYNSTQIVNHTIDSFYTFFDWERFYFYSYIILTDGVKLKFPQEIYKYPLYIDISFQPCPLGFNFSNSQCHCITILKQIRTVKCDIEGPSIFRGGSVWIGTYGNETVAVSKYCPLRYCKIETTELSLHDPNSNSTHSQCNYKHAGILCGGCQHGLSLALGSDQCLHCSNAYISLLLPFALAGIVLVFFIKVLNFTVCQGTINGFIFYANVINANKHLYYDQTATNPITLFIAWFNLDLGIETCFYDGLTAYARTWLQFVFPIYIWCLAAGIIFLANHSRWVAKLSGNNGVPVLATLFLLSYAKLFTTIIKVVSYTTLHTTQGDKLVWSVDGNIDYLGPKHSPLFATAVAALLFLWLPYTLLLVSGKYLHKINCRLLTRILMKLKPFLDANYAPFHDRHQYWFGGILIVKAVVLLSSVVIPASDARIVVFSVAISSAILTFWGHMVFCKKMIALVHTSFFLNLVLLNITKLLVFDSISDMSVISFTLIGLILAQYLGLILLKIINYCNKVIKWNEAVVCCCRRKERGEDDWELYLQASLERKEESVSDEETECDASIESLPTY